MVSIYFGLYLLAKYNKIQYDVNSKELMKIIFVGTIGGPICTLLIIVSLIFYLVFILSESETLNKKLFSIGKSEKVKK